MPKRNRLWMTAVAFLIIAGVALLGSYLGKKTARVEKSEGEESALRCAYDGIKIRPLYQVDAYMVDGKTVSFCSIYCAQRWFERNKERVVYLTVIDEVTGERFDSTLGYFVESDLTTIPEVKNRIHAFAVKEDALTHARQFNGKPVENPFGKAFVLPEAARLDKMAIGVPALPDAMPLKLSVFRPIFKENRLDIRLIPFSGEGEGNTLLSEGKVDGIICDLPTGLAMSKGTPPVRIVKNMLRANPFRPLFALVAGPQISSQDLTSTRDLPIAVPQGITFRFYLEYYLKSMDIPIEKVSIREVKDMAGAWDLLSRKEVTAALLRTPYTDMAREKGLIFLADDRNLPWMSVMILQRSVIEGRTEVIRRFLFGLEQSVLALNLKPDEFRSLLKEQGGLPKDFRERFPMPIFEGANCPSPDEIAMIKDWLSEKGILDRKTAYEEIVDPRFLPNPKDVGLAFCCR